MICLKETSRRRQSGALLVISIIILLLMTVIGMSAVEMTTLEEKMVVNHRDQQLAFHAAESALRRGESDIEAMANTDGFDDSGGLYGTAYDLSAFDTLVSKLTSASSSVSYSSGQQSIPYLSQQPRYVAQPDRTINIGGALNMTGYGNSPTAANTVTVFKISALGRGSTAASRVILQSTYGKAL